MSAGETVVNLEAAISSLEVGPGRLLVVQPGDGFAFPTRIIQKLQDGIRVACPGTPAIIFGFPSRADSVELDPSYEEGEEYQRGWRAAMKAISEASQP